MFWSSSSVQVFVFEVKVERTHVIKACTVTSGEMVDVVLCEPLCEGLDVDMSRIVNSSMANRSGTASSSSRNVRIQIWDDREETHIRHFADRYHAQLQSNAK
jgi:hypothetical protein